MKRSGWEIERLAMRHWNQKASYRPLIWGGVLQIFFFSHLLFSFSFLFFFDAGSLKPCLWRTNRVILFFPFCLCLLFTPLNSQRLPPSCPCELLCFILQYSNVRERPGTSMIPLCSKYPLHFSQASSGIVFCVDWGRFSFCSCLVVLPFWTCLHLAVERREAQCRSCYYYYRPRSFFGACVFHRSLC